MPPGLHQGALADFSGVLRAALAELSDASLDDRAWAQARLGLKRGGLGLRGPDEHAPAAYLASVASVTTLAKAIDTCFSELDPDGSLQLAQARAALQSRILPDAAVDLEAGTYRQKHLSRLVDAKSYEALRQHPHADRCFAAHLALQSAHGAGAWLTAPPADADREVDPVLFRICLQRRLRLRVQDTDAFCPLCGGTMDTFGDHALVCPCNGDRTTRHNALRNVVFTEAGLGGMSPEREKAGLLPGRPLEDGVREGGAEDPVPAASRRRPADVFLPRGPGGSASALDFACTSGMRADLLHTSAIDPAAVVSAYEAFKRGFTPPGDVLSTETLCHQQGLRFLPMVIEAHGGGWGKTARQTLDAVAKCVSASSTDDTEAASLRIAQRLSTTLHRENARAILRRRVQGAVMEANDELFIDAPPLW